MKLPVRAEIALCVVASACQPCCNCYRNPDKRWADKKAQVYAAFKFDGSQCGGYWNVEDAPSESDDMTILVDLEDE